MVWQIVAFWLRGVNLFWSHGQRVGALAEAEVEYEDKEDSPFLWRSQQRSKEKLEINEDASVIIWTTTPWTLPANVGISFNPDEDCANNGWLYRCKRLYLKSF